jgi:hypothetical protein
MKKKLKVVELLEKEILRIQKRMRELEGKDGWIFDKEWHTLLKRTILAEVIQQEAEKKWKSEII